MQTAPDDKVIGAMPLASMVTAWSRDMEIGPIADPSAEKSEMEAPADAPVSLHREAEQA